MNVWFGDPWPALQCWSDTCADDLLRVETPIGDVCAVCGARFIDGDCGTGFTIVHSPTRTRNVLYEHGWVHAGCSEDALRRLRRA